jgi:hypothetical protein
MFILDPITSISLQTACPRYPSYWWFKFTFKTIPNRFRGRLADEALDAFTRDEPNEEPTTVVAATTKNRQLLVIALVALCVASGVIDFDSPWSTSMLSQDELVDLRI